MIRAHWLMLLCVSTHANTDAPSSVIKVKGVRNQIDLQMLLRRIGVQTACGVNVQAAVMQIDSVNVLKT